LYSQGAAHEIGKHENVQLSHPAKLDPASLNRSMQRLTPAAALILTGVVLAGCQTVASSPRTSLYEPIRQSKLVAHAKAVKAAGAARAAKAARAARAKAARARAARARAGQAAAPVRPAETNRPAPRPAGCGQITRMVSVTENLWRIECGPRAFLVRTAPDGYATTVRRLP